MSTKSVTTELKSKESAAISKLLDQYGCGPIQFVGTDNALYERHLLFDTVIDLKDAGPRERFEAVAHSVRDVLRNAGCLRRTPTGSRIQSAFTTFRWSF